MNVTEEMVLFVVCVNVKKQLLFRRDIISWVTGLLHFNTRQFITLLNVSEDVNSWLRVPYEVHEH